MNNFDITWLIAAMSITGSFLNIKKNRICFIFWAVCEIICFFIDINNGQFGRAFLDVFCLGINIYGIFKWKDKKDKKFNVKKVTKISRW